MSQKRLTIPNDIKTEDEVKTKIIIILISKAKGRGMWDNLKLWNNEKNIWQSNDLQRFLMKHIRF